jgi:hypothetical protein
MDARAPQPDSDESWLRRNHWRLGMLLVAAAGGGWWWHRASREPRISVGAVSERWLAEQAFEAGQHSPE